MHPLIVIALLASGFASGACVALVFHKFILSDAELAKQQVEAEAAAIKSHVSAVIASVEGRIRADVQHVLSKIGAKV
jgi:hypothetical protein